MFSDVGTHPVLTAADVERISIPGKVTELIRGRLVVREPPGTWHGIIAATLTRHLGDFVARHALGTVRAPDVAFIGRQHTGLIRERGYAELAPDLLAEILSPDDRPGEVLAKVADWLAAGTKLVWVLDPDRLEVRVHRRDGSLAILHESDSLDGEDVLPGFNCPVRQVFASPLMRPADT